MWLQKDNKQLASLSSKVSSDVHLDITHCITENNNIISSLQNQNGLLNNLFGRSNLWSATGLDSTSSNAKHQEEQNEETEQLQLLEENEEGLERVVILENEKKIEALGLENRKLLSIAESFALENPLPNDDFFINHKLILLSYPIKCYKQNQAILESMQMRILKYLNSGSLFKQSNSQKQLTSSTTSTQTNFLQSHSTPSTSTQTNLKEVWQFKIFPNELKIGKVLAENEKLLASLSVPPRDMSFNKIQQYQENPRDMSFDTIQQYQENQDKFMDVQKEIDACLDKP